MINNLTDVRRVLDSVKAEGRTVLTAPEGRLVCEAYGITVPKEGMATSATEATAIATAMGFPAVLKIVSSEILHKTEAGGVLVDVKNAEAVQKGFDTVIANAKNYDANANWMSDSAQPVPFCIGSTNSIHAYCKLAIMTIATSEATSGTHRLFRSTAFLLHFGVALWLRGAAGVNPTLCR
jgi:hypothetical protein